MEINFCNLTQSESLHPLGGRWRVAPDERYLGQNAAVLHPHQSPAVTASPTGEALLPQPANRDTRSAGFLLFGAQWAIIVLYVHTAHTTYNKEGLSREYIHYDENCRIDPVG